MKEIVIHKQVYVEMPEGGELNTTLCGRVRNDLVDGSNVGNEITCKFCLAILGNPKHWNYIKYKIGG